MRSLLQNEGDKEKKGGVGCLIISKVDPSTVKVNIYAIYKQTECFFKIFYGMSATDFERLINLVGPRIERKNTTFRKCIPVKERVK